MIETEQKIEERFNGKINGLGDSINDEMYIWDYKENAKEIQFTDTTGYINLRMKEFHESQGVSKQGQAQHTHQPGGMHHPPHHSNSAHGMMQTPGSHLPMNMERHASVPAGVHDHKQQWMPTHQQMMNNQQVHNINMGGQHDMGDYNNML